MQRKYWTSATQTLAIWALALLNAAIVLIGVTTLIDTHDVARAEAVNETIPLPEAISKTAMQQTIMLNDTVTYTIVLDNRDSDLGTDVFELVDTVPKELDVDRNSMHATSHPGEIDYYDDELLHQVVWSGFLLPSEVVTLTYAATLVESPLTNTITNTVLLVARESPTATAVTSATVTVMKMPGESLTSYLPILFSRYMPFPPLPLVINGHFDDDQPNGWKESIVPDNGASLIVSSAELPDVISPRSGDKVVWLGGFNGRTTSIEQTITFDDPDAYSVYTNTIYLEYWYTLGSNETNCDNRDEAYVEINDERAEEGQHTLCRNNQSTVWAKRRIRLEPPVPETVKLRFVATLDEQANSNFWIDDVSICSDHPKAAQGSRCE